MHQTIKNQYFRSPLVIATANADAESRCSSSICCWGVWPTPPWTQVGPLLWWVLAMLMPWIWPGTESADAVLSLLGWFTLLLLHELWAVAEEPVDVSDIDEPDDENGGSDLSDGDGDGAFRRNCPNHKYENSS